MDHHCPPSLASLFIPYVKLLNKIQIAFYYLLTEYYWSLRSEELLFQWKYFGQFGGISNDIFITLKISNIDWITESVFYIGKIKKLPREQFQID